MRPVILKTENLAPVSVQRAGLHEMACAFVEERFKLKGRCAPVFATAAETHVAWVECDWANDGEKLASVEMMRITVQATNAHAYSFMTEAWVAAFDTLKPDEAERWITFCGEHGVSALPGHLRDDVALVLTFDRQGGCSMSRYLVTQRRRGPNFLGPRVDDDGDTGMTGRMASLFEPSDIGIDVEKVVAKFRAAIGKVKP
jgi:hypothetical protein